MSNQYYIRPFHNEFTIIYDNAWHDAIADIELFCYDKAIKNFKSLADEITSMAEYYYANGYFCAICQYASDNKLI